MFSYNKEQHTYTCPRGSILSTNGKWYLHSDNRKDGKGSYHFQRYTTTDCRSCGNRSKCTQSKRNGRAIDRHQYADVMEANAKRVIENPDYYKQRQQIAEHPFGTLKRQRGYTHTNIRGKDKVLGEVGLLFIGYNLTRCMTILGVPQLIKALRECCLLVHKLRKRLILSLFNEFFSPGKKIALC